MSVFNVMDVLRLQVQDGWPDLPNLVPNPNGDDGAWGWVVDDSGWEVDSGDGFIEISSSGTPTIAASTEDIAVPVPDGPREIRAALTCLTAPPNTDFTLGVITNLGTLTSVTRSGAGSLDTGAVVLPAGVTHLRLGVTADWLAPSGPWAVRFNGAILMMGTPVEIAASDPLSEPGWTDVLGSTNRIHIERDELNMSTLEARIIDSTLDPAKTSLIRPGKRCRLQTLVDGQWENLFRGLLGNPSTAYTLKDPNIPDVRRTQIRLVADDPAAQLAGSPRPDGVGTIDELPAVLLGTGVPYVVNGSTAAIDPGETVTVAVNDQASALDQIAITRDSVHGYAWVDRNGVVQAWDADQIDTTVALSVDEADYSDLNVDFDLGRCINTVKVNVLRINPGTGETEEVEFGPFIDAASVREWGPHGVSFRVQGIDGDDVEAFATAVLAANSIPAVRINEVTMPIRSVEEMEAKALTDLYDLVESSNDRAEIVDQLARATKIQHTIEIVDSPTQPHRWTMVVGFETDGSVASPQVTPGPTPGGGKTLAELLMPVGKLDEFLCAKADIPAGWLPLDGSTFDAATYPKLFALLGSNVLPDFTDRTTVGAGSKALLTVGGSPTVVLEPENLPPHPHSMNHDHDANSSQDVGNASGSFRRGNGSTSPVTNAFMVEAFTGNTGDGPGTSEPVDILNPWVAVWKCVRAA